jgi:Ni/Co efflux regulator RcnB
LCALPRRQAEGRLKMRQQGGEEDERRVDGDRAWRRPETVGVFDLRAVEGQARRSGRGQPWPGSYRTYASV